MHAHTSDRQFRNLAAEALASLFEHTSAICLREINLEPQRADRAVDILARIEVYGHARTLACKVNPGSIRAALLRLHEYAVRSAENAMPVLIAPALSLKEQALCRESNAGFLDLDGNARLDLDEVFIAKRSMPLAATQRPSASAQRTPDRLAAKYLPTAHIEAPQAVFSKAAPASTAHAGWPA